MVHCIILRCRADLFVRKKLRRFLGIPNSDFKEVVFSLSKHIPTITKEERRGQPYRSRKGPKVSYKLQQNEFIRTILQQCQGGDSSQVKLAKSRPESAEGRERSLSKCAKTER